MRKRLIYAGFLTTLIIIISCLPLVSYLFKDLVTSKLEEILGMEVIQGRTLFMFPDKMVISGLQIIDKNGTAVKTEEGDFKFELSKIVIRRAIVFKYGFKAVTIDSDIRDSLNDILAPLGIPHQGDYKFDSISGMAVIRRDFFEVKNLKAEGQDFKFDGEFSWFKGKVAYKINLKINKAVLQQGCGEKQDLLAGSQMFLTEGADGWYSAELCVKGEPRNPSEISFSGGGIRLEVHPNGAAVY